VLVLGFCSSSPSSLFSLTLPFRMVSDASALHALRWLCSRHSTFGGVGIPICLCSPHTVSCVASCIFALCVLSLCLCMSSSPCFLCFSMSLSNFITAHFVIALYCTSFRFANFVLHLHSLTLAFLGVTELRWHSQFIVACI
jgi:hypothetical protein